MKIERKEFKEIIKLVEDNEDEKLIKLKIEYLKEKYKDYYASKNYQKKLSNFFNYFNMENYDKSKYLIYMDKLLSTIKIYRSDLPDTQKYYNMKLNCYEISIIADIIITNYDDEIIKEILNIYKFIKYNEKLSEPKSKSKQTMNERITKSNMIHFSKINKIFKSNLSYMDKLYYIHLEYKKSDFLLKKIELLDINIIGKELYKEIMDIYCFYKTNEENGILSNLIKMIHNKQYYVEVSNHKHILNDYLKSEEYDVLPFLIKYNIKEKNFERALLVVKKVDYEFYLKCIEKLKIAKIKRYYKIKQTLLCAITNFERGFDDEGNIYDELDFIKDIPVRNSREYKLVSLGEDVYIDCKRVDNEIYFINLRKIINEHFSEKIYIVDKLIKICMDKNNLRELNLNRIYNCDTSVNGIVITNEMNDNIINYMKENEFPMFEFIYYRLRNIELAIGIDNYKKQKQKQKVKK